MARKRNKDEYVERLERELRDLKSVNRQLMRRLKKVDRQFRQSEELEDEAQRETEVRAKPAYDCRECKQGNLKELDLGTRKYQVCSFCGKKTRV